MVNLMMIIMVPFGAFQLFTSRHIAGFLTENAGARAYHFFKKGLQISIVCSLVFAMVSFIFASQLTHFFRVNSEGVFQLLSVIILLILPFQIFLGFFQGTKSFATYCFAILTESSMRLLLGYTLLRAGLELMGVVISLIGSYGMATILCIGLLRKKVICWKLGASDSGVVNDDIMKNLLKIFTSFLLFGIMVFSDILLVKHFFSPEYAGDYGAAANIGRFFFFIPLPLVTIMYPKVVEQHSQGKLREMSFLFMNIILAVFLACGTFVVVCYFFSPEIIKVFLDVNKYAHIGYLIHYMSIIMSFFVLTNVLLHYNIARDRFTHLTIIACGLVVQILLICLYHDSLRMVMQVLTLTSIGMFLLFLITTLYQDAKARVEK
jgi:O-antigen/teichoic acid export membrane protein